jgi:hypothetical protein
MIVTVDPMARHIVGDPEHRPVLLFEFQCQCGMHVVLYGTRGSQFSLPDYFPQEWAPGHRDLNVWHLEVHEDTMTLDVSPSIGLDQLKSHKPQCHLVLSGVPFKWGEA